MIDVPNPYGSMERARWDSERLRLELLAREEQDIERRRLLERDLNRHIGWGRYHGWYQFDAFF